MRVWVYPEKTYEELGARRWEVEWYELTPGARKRYAADVNYEHDHDRDEESVSQVFPTKAEAMAFAEAMDLSNTVYGCALVTEQVVDWYVEEDRVAEWVNVGNPEEVTS